MLKANPTGFAFQETEFIDVHVGMTDKNEIGLYMDARILGQSDPGVTSAANLEKMINALITKGEYKDKTKGGTPTHVMRVDK
jgi:hypothetical protein